MSVPFHLLMLWKECVWNLNSILVIANSIIVAKQFNNAKQFSLAISNKILESLLMLSQKCKMLLKICTAILWSTKDLSLNTFHQIKLANCTLNFNLIKTKIYHRILLLYTNVGRRLCFRFVYLLIASVTDAFQIYAPFVCSLICGFYLPT